MCCRNDNQEKIVLEINKILKVSCYLSDSVQTGNNIYAIYIYAYTVKKKKKIKT